MKRAFFHAFAFLCVVTLGITQASAQNYPSREIHVIVGFPAGSGADVYARFFANKLQKLAGVTVLVENKPGAAASIATEYVARAKPDGYTLYIGGTDIFWFGKVYIQKSDIRSAKGLHFSIAASQPSLHPRRHQRGKDKHRGRVNSISKIERRQSVLCNLHKPVDHSF